MPLLRILIKLLPWLLVIWAGIYIFRQCDGIFPKKEKVPEVVVNHQTILTAVEDLGKMELVRYQLQDVLNLSKKAPSSIPFSSSLPRSRIQILVGGEAVGCIDMQQLTAEDITFQGDSVVVIQLPKPEICYFKVDHSRSKVLSKEYTYFQDAELIEESYKYAEKQVRRAALKSGILKQTAVNADKILKPMLEGVTGRRVILQQKKEQAPLRIPRQ
ncbi:MAG: DUF4230 domain-containing protein [Hymenobacteraceae bacterium]|nr:DUF4230 domain-containing protein [Hymenobacteraceae bacterium]MDX5511311.1 DUF4230 domain-containing protein [Hymenobacteraceae bacterium]